LKDALDPHEVPRVETENEITYVFARVPRDGGETQMATTPVLIALGETFILTVSAEEVSFLDRFSSGALDFYTTQKVKLFIQFFSAITSVYNRRLTTMAKRVRAMNAACLTATNRDIANFAEMEKILNDYLAALLPMGRLLAKLLGGGVRRLYFHPTDEELVEDLLIDIRQLEEVCHGTLKYLIGIRTAHATIVANNLNNTMKMLAALTVVLTVPTIIASFFGMNVPVPFSDSPSSFAGVVVATMLFMLLIVLLFRRKRWL
ncbi:MAG TPA: magnesium transporter CorA family protein, partial [Candidatus Moranbacteria bacterium]|nr:magnesium transporter CorA family protein [Candidatus Moranbacteria bacterium]